MGVGNTLLLSQAAANSVAGLASTGDQIDALKNYDAGFADWMTLGIGKFNQANTVLKTGQGIMAAYDAYNAGKGFGTILDASTSGQGVGALGPVGGTVAQALPWIGLGMSAYNAAQGDKGAQILTGASALAGAGGYAAAGTLAGASAAMGPVGVIGALAAAGMWASEQWGDKPSREYFSGTSGMDLGNGRFLLTGTTHGSSGPNAYGEVDQVGKGGYLYDANDNTFSVVGSYLPFMTLETQMRVNDTIKNGPSQAAIDKANSWEFTVADVDPMGLMASISLMSAQEILQYGHDNPMVFEEWVENPSPFPSGFAYGREPTADEIKFAINAYVPLAKATGDGNYSGGIDPLQYGMFKDTIVVMDPGFSNTHPVTLWSIQAAMVEAADKYGWDISPGEKESPTVVLDKDTYQQLYDVSDDAFAQQVEDGIITQERPTHDGPAFVEDEDAYNETETQTIGTMAKIGDDMAVNVVDKNKYMADYGVSSEAFDKQVTDGIINYTPPVTDDPVDDAITTAPVDDAITDDTVVEDNPYTDEPVTDALDPVDDTAQSLEAQFGLAPGDLRAISDKIKTAQEGVTEAMGSSISRNGMNLIPKGYQESKINELKSLLATYNPYALTGETKANEELYNQRWKLNQQQNATLQGYKLDSANQLNTLQKDYAQWAKDHDINPTQDYSVSTSEEALKWVTALGNGSTVDMFGKVWDAGGRVIGWAETEYQKYLARHQNDAAAETPAIGTGDGGIGTGGIGPDDPLYYNPTPDPGLILPDSGPISIDSPIYENPDTGMGL